MRNKFIKWVIFPIVIVAIFAVILAGFSIYQEKSFTTLTREYTNSLRIDNLHQTPGREQKIIGKFKAEEDYLGGIYIPVKLVKIFPNSYITFQIRDISQKEWYYKNVYNTSIFGNSNELIFGFVPISHSKTHVYTFEAEVKGTKGKIFNVDGATRSIFVTYQYSKKTLMADKYLLFQFSVKRLLYAIETNISSILTFAVFCYLLLIGTRLLAIYNPTGLYALIKNYRVILILVIGSMLRLILALGPGNFDMHSAEQYAHIFHMHLNIYAHSQYYNYPPIIFYIDGLLYEFHLKFSFLPFPFLERSFLTLFDVLTTIVLMLIAQKRNISTTQVAFLFFLNPISIILSGHHGQLDNVSIFFLLLAIYLYQNSSFSLKTKKITASILLILGLLVKQLIIFHLLIISRYLYKRRVKALVAFSVFVSIFCLSFLPFFNEARTQIIHQVFQYGGLRSFYGISYLIFSTCLTCKIGGVLLMNMYGYLFLAAYFGFILYIPYKDVFRSLLLVSLFFLTFTSGIGAQYFILPVAFGALFPTKWFYLYSLATTLFFFGSIDELNIALFQTFTWNTVWLFVICWFFSELLTLSKTMRMLYHKIVS